MQEAVREFNQRRDDLSNVGETFSFFKSKETAAQVESVPADDAPNEAELATLNFIESCSVESLRRIQAAIERRLALRIKRHDL